MGAGVNSEVPLRNRLPSPVLDQLAFARLLLASPQFAFLGEATGSLEPRTAGRLYDALRRSPTNYVSVSNDPGLRDFQDTVLEFGPDGSWTTAEVEAPLSGRAVLQLAN